MRLEKAASGKNHSSEASYKPGGRRWAAGVYLGLFCCVVYRVCVLGAQHLRGEVVHGPGLMELGSPAPGQTCVDFGGQAFTSDWEQQLV